MEGNKKYPVKSILGWGPPLQPHRWIGDHPSENLISMAYKLFLSFLSYKDFKMPDLNCTLEASHLSHSVEKKKLEMSSVLADHDCILIPSIISKRKRKLGCGLSWEWWATAEGILPWSPSQLPSYDEWAWSFYVKNYGNMLTALLNYGCLLLELVEILNFL